MKNPKTEKVKEEEKLQRKKKKQKGEKTVQYKRETKALGRRSTSRVDIKRRKM